MIRQYDQSNGNHCRSRVMIIMLLVVSQSVFAQRQGHGPESRPQRTREMQRAERGREHASEERRLGMRWLQELEASDPEEFAALQALREEDPQAFMERIRAYMQQQRRNALLERHPAFKKFLESLPDEERKALESDLFRFPRNERTRRQQNAEDPAPPRRMRREKIDPAQFDAQTQYFADQLERAEERIEQLRTLLERRRALREQLVDDE